MSSVPMTTIRPTGVRSRRMGHRHQAFLLVVHEQCPAADSPVSRRHGLRGTASSLTDRHQSCHSLPALGQIDGPRGRIESSGGAGSRCRRRPRWSPRPGADRSTAPAASSASVPRRTSSCSLVSSRHRAPRRSPPHASARSRRVAAVRPGDSNRTVVRSSAAMRAMRSRRSRPRRAGTPRTPSAAPGCRWRRAPRGPRRRPGWAPRDHPRRPRRSPARRPGR